MSGEQLPAVNTWFKRIEIILLICTMATIHLNTKRLKARELAQHSVLPGSSLRRAGLAGVICTAMNGPYHLLGRTVLNCSAGSIWQWQVQLLFCSTYIQTTIITKIMHGKPDPRRTINYTVDTIVDIYYIPEAGIIRAAPARASSTVRSTRVSTPSPSPLL